MDSIRLTYSVIQIPEKVVFPLCWMCFPTLKYRKIYVTFRRNDKVFSNQELYNKSADPT
jgi:hypothetical protein